MATRLPPGPGLPDATRRESLFAAQPSSNNAAGEQGRDPFGGDAPIGERAARTLSHFARRRWAVRRRPAEARRWRRLRHPVEVDERSARDVVRMMRRLGHGENRRKAGVGAFQELAPLVSAAGPEKLLEFRRAAAGPSSVVYGRPSSSNNSARNFSSIAAIEM